MPKTILTQDKGVELPAIKCSLELAPEEKAFARLVKGQGGEEDCAMVMRMFGAKMDGKGE